jgi:hypothetical protein
VEEKQVTDKQWNPTASDFSDAEQTEFRRHLSRMHPAIHQSNSTFYELLNAHNVQHEHREISDAHKITHFQMKIAIEMEKAKMNDTITYTELAESLERLYGARKEATKIREDIQNHKPTMKVDKVESENITITENELYDAFNRFSLKTPDTKPTAGDIIKQVKSMREPAYPPRSVWQDAKGTFYQRSIGGNGWYSFGSNSMLDNDVPVRPLTRMDK